MKFAKRFLIAVFVIYLLPALASAGLWAMKEHPTGYRNARWSSAGILPDAPADKPAAIYVYSAMTGGLKGSLASHAWIVVKKKGPPATSATTRLDGARRYAATLMRPMHTGIPTCRGVSWNYTAMKPNG